MGCYEIQMDGSRTSIPLRGAPATTLQHTTVVTTNVETGLL